MNIGTPSVRSDMSPFRVLVVDDEEDIRVSLADVLSAEGYDVDTAPNGFEAWQRLQAQRPDVVLVDLMMPVMNGWDFQARVRHDPMHATTPLVAVSAVRDPDSGTRFNAYLRKPFDIETLLGVVERFRQVE
jgi:CheY-like chemotaxis protein